MSHLTGTEDLDPEDGNGDLAVRTSVAIDYWLEAACNTIVMCFRFELSELLGIAVDVLTPGALPESVRNKVLAEAQPV